MTFTAPQVLREAVHWVCRKGKQPVNAYGQTYSIARTEEGEHITWKNPDFWMGFDQAIGAYERNRSGNIDGIGFIIAYDSDRVLDQIVGLDLDCCRDPITGWVSPWALDILKKLNSPTGLSISETGFRVFCLGTLNGPNSTGIKAVMGHGPDDLTTEAKEHILERKPDLKDKINKGEPAFNGLEVYVDGPRHLTVTGEWLSEYSAECENRTKELADIIQSSIQRKTTEKRTNKRTNKPRKADTSQKATLPPLSITDVIDTSGFVEEGDQLFGPHPTLGSTTGRNLVVNPSKNVYCYMHNDINAGGDCWIWLACECGAIPWEQAGHGTLGDADVIQQVKQHAVDRGLFTESELFPERKAEISEEDLRAYSLPQGPKFECRLPNDHFIQRFMAYGVRSLMLTQIIGLQEGYSRWRWWPIRSLR